MSEKVYGVLVVTDAATKAFFKHLERNSTDKVCPDRGSFVNEELFGMFRSSTIRLLTSSCFTTAV